MGSAKVNFPCSQSCMAAVAVIVLVIDPTLSTVSGVIGSCWTMFAQPYPLAQAILPFFTRQASETWKMRLFHRGLNELIQVGEEITPGYHSCPSGDNSSYYHIRSDGERAGSA